LIRCLAEKARLHGGLFLACDSGPGAPGDAGAEPMAAARPVPRNGCRVGFSHARERPATTRGARQYRARIQ